MRPKLKGLSGDSQEIDLSSEVERIKLIRISIGTFAGTEERAFVIRDGRAHAFDTGDQGGGQN
jgi:hypothetical protein